MSKEKSISHHKSWFGEKPVLILYENHGMWLTACRGCFQLNEIEPTIDLVKTTSLSYHDHKNSKPFPRRHYLSNFNSPEFHSNPLKMQ